MGVATKTQSIGLYLLDRLHELGVDHIFGVPGDYVIRMDKMIEQHEIKFINATRENTAGFIADAYARMRGLGVACITYGVGINIANATSQAYVEGSPIVILSGAAGTDEFQKCQLLHHLINKSYSLQCDETQLEIFKQITVAQALLHNAENAAEEIDRVLGECLQKKQPVYIEIPRNMVDAPIPDHEPQPLHKKKSDRAALQEALDETAKILDRCQKPVLWVGHDIQRRNLGNVVTRFAETYGIPVVSSLLGKTVVDERNPLFVGVYQGGLSNEGVIQFVDSCDCAFIFGVLMHDLDTGIFTAKSDQNLRVIATPETIHIGHHHYHHVAFEDFIQGLSQIALDKRFTIPFPKKAPLEKFHLQPQQKTTIVRVFACLQQHLRPEHFIVSDIGDCLFASADLVLPQNSYMACAYFSTLGFGVPAAIGVQIANPQRRAVAIVGDGAFQMTAMELSTAVRYKLDPIIIILNNHGYGTERPLLEGTYNDIVDWNYSEIPRVLGDGIGFKATTEDELERAFVQAFEKRGTFFLIEVCLDKNDFSPGLRRLGELLGKRI